MSYIEIDFDASRRCAALIKSQAEQLRALLSEASEPAHQTNSVTDLSNADITSAQLRALADFCATLDTLSADLSEETEALAAIDDRMKELHHMTNDGGRTNHG